MSSTSLLLGLHPSVTREWSVVDWDPAVAKALTFKSKYAEDDNDEDGVIKCWRRVGDHLLIPVGAARIGAVDNRVHYPVPNPFCPEEDQTPKKPPLDEEQLQLIAKSVGLLKGGYNHIFEAPTGFGKSYCGSAIAYKLGQPTIILVTKQDLMESWRRTLIDLIGVPEHQIGIAQASKLKWKDCRFVLGMVQSVVIPNKFKQEFFDHFGMVIFDEVHRMGAPYFNRACGLFPAKYRLGMSATPHRGDNLDPVFKCHIGPVLVRGVRIPMKPKILVKQTGWRIPKTKQYDPVEGKFVMRTMKVTPGQMTAINKRMAADMHRNKLIANFVKQAYDAGRQTVVMSDFIDDHLVPLFHLFASEGIPGEDMDYYIGGRKKIELDSAKKKRVVLATYAMCSEGTDVPSWDTLVLAVPRANVKQPLGRILRKVHGKRQPVCFDLVDYDSVFSGFYGKRETQYYEVKAQIVKV